jgi:hypothetical protein
MSAPDEDFRSRQERAANNQTLFREVNERVKDVNVNFHAHSAVSEWVCECANDTCFERVEMSMSEYEDIRSAGERFFVAPSDEHVWPDVEQVTVRNDRYWVLEKAELAGKLAKRADPRAATTSPTPE